MQTQVEWQVQARSSLLPVAHVLHQAPFPGHPRRVAKLPPFPLTISVPVARNRWPKDASEPGSLLRVHHGEQSERLWGGPFSGSVWDDVVYLFVHSTGVFIVFSILLKRGSKNCPFG